jgi:hypothetical protein
MADLSAGGPENGNTGFVHRGSIMHGVTNTGERAKAWTSWSVTHFLDATEHVSGLGDELANQLQTAL